MRIQDVSDLLIVSSRQTDPTRHVNTSRITYMRYNALETQDLGHSPESSLSPIMCAAM